MLLALLLAVALLLRAVVLSKFWEDLDRDPDGYLALARSLARGAGFCNPGTDLPTAYRPPFYPMLLVPISGAHQDWGRAIFHLLLACGTLLLIWKAGSQLGLPRWGRLLAASLYAADPLSLRYVSYPMTETLCAFWVAWLIVRLTKKETRSTAGSFGTGILFGFCVLTRPTFWLFGAAYAAGALGMFIGFRRNSTGLAMGTGSGRRPLWRALAAGLGIAVCVFPWVLRNWLVLGTPIVMTTHGGYTLLLGNNEAFYREVVEQPLGTIWDGSHGGGQPAWIRGVLEEISREGISTEVAEDQWMSARAWQTIRQQPFTFLKAAGIKFLWFWNIKPHTVAGGDPIPPLVLAGVATFNLLVWILLVTGLLRVGTWIWSKPVELAWWGVPLLFIFSLTAAHLFYWSDARMRAPIVPAIALVAAAGLAGRQRQSPAVPAAVRRPVDVDAA
jgi:hypothetical protein